MRKASLITALSLLLAAFYGGTAYAQTTTTTTTPGVPSTGYETDIATGMTLGVTALVAALALGYFFSRRRTP